MKLLALAFGLMVFAAASAGERPPGQRHEYDGRTLTVAPIGAKADWRPSARVKVNDSVSVLYPIDPKDVDLFECASDNRDVRISFGADEKGKGVRVGVRSGDGNGGKKATAKIRWTVIDFQGREHQGWLDVTFDS